jgi:large repetitive protein
VLLTDGSGNILVTAYVRGTGTGPEATFIGPLTAPSSKTKLGGGFSRPQGLAVDGGGNVYVADMTNNSVKEIPAGCTIASYVQTLGSGAFTSPRGVAVDGAGNIFVADWGDGAVKEIPPGCATASCVRVLVSHHSGINSSYGIAVDSNGNVFFADLGTNTVNEIVASSGYATVNVLGGGFTFAQPEGVAVDGSGNVFVVETGITSASPCNGVVCATNSTSLLEITAASNYATAKLLQNKFNAPIFVAVNGVGNVFVSELISSIGEVQEFLASENYYARPWSLDLACDGIGYCDRTGVAIDGAGNIYVANDDPGVNTVTKLDYADPPALTFATPTASGSIDLTDLNEQINILNNGNSPLNISAITPSTNFGVIPSDIGCTTTAAVAPDAYCGVYAYFAPITTGAVTGTLSFTDNNLNSVSTTQQANLSGIGVVPSPTITSEPPSSTGTTSAEFSFTDTQAGITYVCSLDGAAYTACTSGISYPSLTLAAHTFGVEAKDSAGNVSVATSYPWTVTAPSVPVTLPPPPVITSGPPYLSSSTTATLTFTDAEAGATFLCSLNSSPLAACTSPTTYTSLGNGNYAFLVLASDSGGASININGVAYSFAVEPAPPTPPSTAGVFRKVPVATTSAQLTLTVSLTDSGTVGSIAALTQGAAGLDFATATCGTCAAGAAYITGNTCTVNATFTPKAPGARSGAILLLDTSVPAKVLATVYVSGTGVGPAVSFGPSIINTAMGGGPVVPPAL